MRTVHYVALAAQMNTRVQGSTPILLKLMSSLPHLESACPREFGDCLPIIDLEAPGQCEQIYRPYMCMVPNSTRHVYNQKAMHGQAALGDNTRCER